MPVARIVYSWNFELFCLALAHDQPNNLASVDDWICMLATLETTVCGPLRVLPTQPAMVGRAAGGLLWRGRYRGRGGGG